MNYFGPTSRGQKSTSLPGLIVATTLLLSSLPIMAPVKASAVSSLWVDNEVATSLNVGNDAQVNSVSCTSNNFCVAGGQYKDGNYSGGANNNSQAFVSLGNGSSWVDSELAGSLNFGNSQVNSVTCLSSTSCIAGGAYQDNVFNYQPFVSVFDGVNWVDYEVATSLNIGHFAASPNAFVESISCTSNTSCIAGGQYTDSNNNWQAFVSMYNGSSWSDHEIARTLNVGGLAFVNSVSCTSITSCVAGGQYTDRRLKQEAFVSIFNGNVWVDHKVAGSLNAGKSAWLNAVNCISRAWCIAGGAYTDGNKFGQAFVSVYNGRSWVDRKVAGTLNVGHSAQVMSASCASPTSCVVGGNYSNSPYKWQAFVSIYNGRTWVDHKVAGSLNVGNSGQINWISCKPGGLCVAGGYYSDSKSGYQAFVTSSM